LDDGINIDRVKAVRASDSDEPEGAVAASGPEEPGVLSYARQVGSYEGKARKYGWLIVPATFVVFLLGLGTETVWVALLAPPVGVVVYVGCRLIEDGHRPVWLAAVVALLAGVAMASTTVQAAVIAGDPGHPQSRWRLESFEASLVAVPTTIGAVLAYRRMKRER
jgi:hypothetical protein